MSLNNCKIDEPISSVCGDYSLAGLSSIWLANREDIVSYAEDSIGLITGITMASGTSFYEYSFSEDTAFFTQPFTNSNGNIAYTASIEFRIPGMNAAIINALSKLDFAKLVVIVRTRNGEFYIFGRYNPMKRVGGENSSGTASTDPSGILVTISGGGPRPCQQVDAATATSLALN
jgi:hypothetical protein